MSGHSKWATTKHKKAVIDGRRAKLFAKYRPDSIYHLRMYLGLVGHQTFYLHHALLILTYLLLKLKQPLLELLKLSILLQMYLTLTIQTLIQLQLILQ